MARGHADPGSPTAAAGRGNAGSPTAVPDVLVAGQARHDAVPDVLVAGAERHGVVRFAADLARAVAAQTGKPVKVERVAARRVHVQFTDRLWGSSPERAAAAIEALAAAAPLTVTVHDLPQPGDGPAQAARAACFARVAAAARGVAVSSRHEARLLAAFSPVTPAVLPLPVQLAPPAAPAGALRDEVALLGFLYPGKGHAEAIEAAATHPGLAVTALGAPSPGHEEDARELARTAAELGVPFTVTGWLEDAALLERCRHAAVPLAAHRNLSASGSIATWIGAGRRVLVPDTPATRELDALRPGTLTRYTDLGAAIGHARAVPASTFWGPDAQTGPDLAAVAAAYVAWWTRQVAW